MGENGTGRAGTQSRISKSSSFKSVLATSGSFGTPLNVFMANVYALESFRRFILALVKKKTTATWSALPTVEAGSSWFSYLNESEITKPATSAVLHFS